VDEAIRLHPDFVIMDIRMPRLDGIEATKRLAAQGEKAPRVLVLTTFDLDEYVYKALRAGADGFMVKDAPPRQLAEAVRTVAAGESLLAPAVTKRLIER
jgi:DNA-binding NarL/FixJ family response regulator